MTETYEKYPKIISRELSPDEKEKLKMIVLLNRLERRKYYNNHKKDFQNWKDFNQQLTEIQNKEKK